MKAKVLVAVAAGALVAGASWPAAADVLKDKGCLNCHAMDKKKVGPSLKDIAAKYKGNSGAAADLVAKLKNGKGHMKIKAPDADLEAAVQQVLAAH